MKTIRSFWCQGCAQTDVLSGNHKTKSAAVFRLLTQPKEKRTVRMTNIQKEKAEKDESQIPELWLVF